MAYASRRGHYGIPLLGRLIGRVGTVFIHTEAGARMSPNSTLAQERQRMRAIHLFHVARFGSGFGYNAAINGRSRAGRVHEGRGHRRSGAHTRGYNSSAEALCFLGHGDIDGVTDEAWQAARQWIGDGVAEGAIAPSPRIRGHRDVSDKSCPGNKIYPHIGRLRGVRGPEASTFRLPDSTPSVPSEVSTMILVKLHDNKGKPTGRWGLVNGDGHWYLIPTDFHTKQFGDNKSLLQHLRDASVKVISTVPPQLRTWAPVGMIAMDDKSWTYKVFRRRKVHRRWEY